MLITSPVRIPQFLRIEVRQVKSDLASTDVVKKGCQHTASCGRAATVPVLQQISRPGLSSPPHHHDAEFGKQDISAFPPLAVIGQAVGW